MLFMVWVGVCVPLVCVMVVGVWCVGWCCFQWCVAVVWVSRRVPGVVVGFGVWVVCSGVGWLVVGVCGVCVVGVGVGVGWLVCVVWWFWMLTCLASFFFLVLFFVLSCCLVNNGLSGCVGVGGCLFVGCLGWCGCVVVGVLWGWLVVGCVCLCVWVGVCFVGG